MLDSLLNQTFKDFQLVVIDSGKNSNYIRALENVEDLFRGRLKVLQIESANAFDMLNEGLRAAQGKYVVFLSGQDILLNNFVQILYNVAEQIQADVVYPAVYGVTKAPIKSLDEISANVTSDEKGWTPNQINVIDKNTLPARLQGWMNKIFYPRIYNKLIRREFLLENNINLSPDAYMPEWIFCLKCLLLSEKYVRIPKPLYIHSPEQNLEQNIDVHEMIAGIEELENFMKNINSLNDNPEIRRSILADYMKNFLKMN